MLPTRGAVGKARPHQAREGRVVACPTCEDDRDGAWCRRRGPDDTSWHATDEMGMGGDETFEDLVGECRWVVEEVGHRSASLTGDVLDGRSARHGVASPRRLSATISTPDISISPPTTNIGST